MKQLIASVLVLLAASCAILSGESRIIFWENNDPADEVIAYKVWQWKGSNPTLLASTTTNRTSAIEFKGRNTITITAVNAAGEGPHTTNYFILAKPGQPGGVDSVATPSP